MFTTETHIDVWDIPTVYDDETEGTYLKLFGDRRNCSIRFFINTKYNYPPDKEWQKQISKDLIALGAQEGQWIYLDD